MVCLVGPIIGAGVVLWSLFFFLHARYLDTWRCPERCDAGKVPWPQRLFVFSGLEFDAAKCAILIAISVSGLESRHFEIDVVGIRYFYLCIGGFLYCKSFDLDERCTQSSLDG